mmetsp:Transcript_6347/g.20267  ORF Transcript_6347/g.20267 Transcript_6347/m.20267 type:complete len:289 (-) Transcript_6347:111-977(-)
MLGRLHLEVERLGDDAHGVARRGPSELGVAEELDGVGPGDEARHVEESVRLDRADELEADEVGGEDGEGLDGGDGVCLVGDEDAVLFRNVRVVLRVDPPVQLLVFVAGPVQRVEAQVEPDVEERRAPDDVEERGGGGTSGRNVEDSEANRESEGLGAGDRDLLQHLVGGDVLHRPPLVPVGEPLRRVRLEDAEWQQEEPGQRRAVVAVTDDEVPHRNHDDVSAPRERHKLEPRLAIVQRGEVADVQQVPQEAGAERRQHGGTGMNADCDRHSRQHHLCRGMAAACAHR